MFKAAIFDMDGLLIDSERVIMQACIQAASEFGIEYTRNDYTELIGRTAPESTKIMISQLGGKQPFMQVMHRVDALQDESTNHFPLKAGAYKIIQHFHKQQIPCGVASSSYQKVIKHRLSNVGVLDYFTAITSSDEVKHGKPHLDIYLLAIKKLWLDPKDCIAFEDSELGARAAISAGLNVVVVPDLKQPTDFVKDHCFRVLNSLIEARELILEKCA